MNFKNIIHKIFILFLILSFLNCSSDDNTQLPEAPIFDAFPKRLQTIVENTDLGIVNDYNFSLNYDDLNRLVEIKISHNSENFHRLDIVYENNTIASTSLNTIDETLLEVQYEYDAEIITQATFNYTDGSAGVLLFNYDETTKRYTLVEQGDNSLYLDIGLDDQNNLLNMENDGSSITYNYSDNKGFWKNIDTNIQVLILLRMLHISPHTVLCMSDANLLGTVITYPFAPAVHIFFNNYLEDDELNRPISLNAIGTDGWEYGYTMEYEMRQIN